MEKFGFIYLWFDTSRKRYYIGSHWGYETDGYVCSSDAMRKAYKRRRTDFKRRIVAKIYTNREELLAEEQRWLDMIKPEEYGRKYYNITSKANKSYWWMNEETKRQVSEKIKEGVKHGKHHRPRTKKQKKTQSDQKKAYYASLTPEQRKTGPMSDATREKMQKSWNAPRTDAQIAATKKNQKLGAKASPITKKGWIPKHRIGTKHTPETLEKMRQARLNYYKNITPTKLKQHGRNISKGKKAA